jgi:hypothetical protein
MIASLRAADTRWRLTLLHGHRIDRAGAPGRADQRRVAVDEASGAEVRLQAPVVVLAMGGINGSHEPAAPTGRNTGPCRRPCSTARIPLPTAACIICR